MRGYAVLGMGVAPCMYSVWAEQFDGTSACVHVSVCCMYAALIGSREKRMYGQRKEDESGVWVSGGKERGKDAAFMLCQTREDAREDATEDGSERREDGSQAREDGKGC